MPLNRRKFLSGLLATPFAAKSLKAKDQCQQANAKDDQSSVLIPENKIEYFVNGPLETGRGHIGILFKHRQTEQSYVERMVLSDTFGSTIAVKYLHGMTKIDHGFPPYFIFDQISNSGLMRYVFSVLVIETANNNKNRVTYRYVFDGSRTVHKMISPHYMPHRVQHAFKEKFKNRVFSIFAFSAQFFLQKDCQKNSRNFCRSQHAFNCYLTKLNAQHDFRITVQLNHPSFNASHRPGHIWATDPVGRLLAFQEFKPTGQHSLILKPLTGKERYSILKIGPLDIPLINHCPYIYVFYDDLKEGIFAQMLSITA